LTVEANRTWFRCGWSPALW